jgi:hypothetical protein
MQCLSYQAIKLIYKIQRVKIYSKVIHKTKYYECEIERNFSLNNIILQLHDKMQNDEFIFLIYMYIKSAFSVHQDNNVAVLYTRLKDRK